jgi:hypothetical protein
MYINLFILILVIWLVWGIVEALIRRVRAGNVLLNFVLNREKAIAYANSLNEKLRTWTFRSERIDLLEAELPHLWVLTTGYPLKTTKRWIPRKSVRRDIEELERAMYDDPRYLGRSLDELNKALNLPAVGGVSK